MDELRESSLLFSLEGLLETERERVQREAKEAQARREAELRRVAEAAERRNLQLRREREAAERREILAREQERLEQERLEALKQAAIERARIEAEAGARLVEAEQVRRHDLALAHLREQQGALRYRSLAWLSAGALGVTLAGALGAYFGWIVPARARAEQHLASVRSEHAVRVEATRLALAAEQSKNRALNAELERAAGAAALVASAGAAKLTPAPATSVRRTPPVKTPVRCRDSGDPLDDCLR